MKALCSYQHSPWNASSSTKPREEQGHTSCKLPHPCPTDAEGEAEEDDKRDSSGQEKEAKEPVPRHVLLRVRLSERSIEENVNKLWEQVKKSISLSSSPVDEGPSLALVAVNLPRWLHVIVFLCCRQHGLVYTPRRVEDAALLAGLPQGGGREQLTKDQVGKHHHGRHDESHLPTMQTLVLFQPHKDLPLTTEASAPVAFAAERTLWTYQGTQQTFCMSEKGRTAAESTLWLQQLPPREAPISQAHKGIARQYNWAYSVKTSGSTRVGGRAAVVCAAAETLEERTASFANVFMANSADVDDDDDDDDDDDGDDDDDDDCIQSKRAAEAVFSVTPPTFDPFIMDVELARQLNCSLHVAEATVAADPSALLGSLALARPTIISCITPQVIKSILPGLSQQRSGAGPTISSLRHVCVGGDAFPVAHVLKYWDWDWSDSSSPRGLHSHSAHVECHPLPTLWNIYGLTEAVLWQSLHRVTKTDCLSWIQQNDDTEPSGFPIGRPINPKTLRFTINQDQGVAKDAKSASRQRGELGIFVDGPVLIDNSLFLNMRTPFWTGDIVSVEASSHIRNFAIHGRSNNMVKISGKRVNLEEIERLAGPLLGPLVDSLHNNDLPSLEAGGPTASLSAAKEGDIFCICVKATKPGGSDRSNVEGVHVAVQVPEIVSPSHAPLIIDTAAANDFRKSVREAFGVHVGRIVAVAHFPLNANGKISRKEVLQLVNGAETTKLCLIDKKKAKEAVVETFQDCLPALVPTAPSAEWWESTLWQLGGSSLDAAAVTNHLAQRYMVSFTAVLNAALSGTLQEVADACIVSCAEKSKAPSVTQETKQLPQSSDEQAVSEISPEPATIQGLPSHQKYARVGWQHQHIPNVCTSTRGITRASEELYNRSLSQSSQEGQGNACSLEHHTLFTKWRYHFGKCIDASPLIVTLPAPSETCIPALAHEQSSHNDSSDNERVARAQTDQGETEWMVVIGSHSHDIACLRGSDGALQWRTTLSDRIESTACLSPCGLYVLVGCYDGAIFCLDKMSGTVVRKLNTTGSVRSALIPDPFLGLVYAGSYDGHLYVIGKTLCVAAKIPCGMEPPSSETKLSPLAASPALFPLTRKSSRIVTANLKGTVQCTACTSHDSSRVEWRCAWRRGFGAPIFSTPQPCESGTKVIICLVSGTVACCSLRTGDVHWQRRMCSLGPSTESSIPHAGSQNIHDTDAEDSKSTHAKNNVNDVNNIFAAALCVTLPTLTPSRSGKSVTCGEEEFSPQKQRKEASPGPQRCAVVVCSQQGRVATFCSRSGSPLTQLVHLDGEGITAQPQLLAPVPPTSARVRHLPATPRTPMMHILVTATSGKLFCLALAIRDEVSSAEAAVTHVSLTRDTKPRSAVTLGHTFGTPLVFGKKIVIGSRDDNLYCLCEENGAS